MKPKSFKKFIEEKEKEVSSPHLDSLEDELGIDPRDLEMEPQIASFFSFDGQARNIGPYRIISFKKNNDGKITHAVVKRFDLPGIKNRSYKDEDGNMVRIDAQKGEQKFLVPIGDLDKLLSQDLQPPPQAPGM